MPFLPDASVLLAYSLAAFVLFITPGPDMSLFLAKTVAGGRRAGIAAMTGASLGNVVHSLLAAFGLSALIAASPRCSSRSRSSARPICCGSPSTPCATAPRSTSGSIGRSALRSGRHWRWASPSI